MQAPSYAKLNLRLDVCPKGADGYHPLRGVMVELDVHDDLMVERTDAPGVQWSCNHPDLQVGATNLVTQALLALSKQTHASGGWKVHLTKRIPLQAGLGGGSSNAALALRLGNACLGYPLHEAQLQRLAHTLGSDVPFFLVGKLAWVEGTGEQVMSLTSTYDPWIVLAKPLGGVDTGACYRQWDSRNDPVIERPSMIKALRSNDSQQIQLAMHNDLALAALDLSPEMASLHQTMQTMGFDVLLVCGSGSCLAGLTHSASLAKQNADVLQSYAPFVQVTQFRK